MLRPRGQGGSTPAGSSPGNASLGPPISPATEPDTPLSHYPNRIHAVPGGGGQGYPSPTSAAASSESSQSISTPLSSSLGSGGNHRAVGSGLAAATLRPDNNNNNNDDDDDEYQHGHHEPEYFEEGRGRASYPIDIDEKDIKMNGGVVGGGGGGLGSAGLASRRTGVPGNKEMKLSFGGPGTGLGAGANGKGKAKAGSHRLGLSQRAWLILTVVVGFILISKLMFPSDSTHTHTTPHPVDAHHLLIPRDYLNNSRSDPAPFEFCPVFGPGDAIAARRGQFELLRSRVHMGTGARVQRVLQKAMSGAPVTMSVLGGSISACVGAGDDPVGEKCYPSKFFNWWNSIFPHPANELTNGATKKTDSAYYAYCNAHHMPDQTDLVILEFDAADPNDKEWLSHFELLVRSVMVRPDMPAVIILGHFSPQVQAAHGFAGPELLHNIVAQFYDVPHISVKGLIYDQYLQQPDLARTSFYPDAAHANGDGHDLIADVLISYLMSQICTGWATLQGRSYEVPTLGLDTEGAAVGSPSLLGGVGLRKGMPGQDPGDGDSAGSSLSEKYSNLRVPGARLSDRPHDLEKFREIEPFCVSAGDLINPLPNSLFFGSGWHTYHPPRNAITEDRHYWYAEQPTARLRIPIRLGAGDVGIYYLQSPPDKPLGTVKCWVDDNVAGGKELAGTAEVQEVIATLFMIDRGVSKGSHFVECQLQGEAGGSSPPFKILGIFTT